MFHVYHFIMKTKLFFVVAFFSAVALQTPAFSASSTGEHPDRVEPMTAKELKSVVLDLEVRAKELREAKKVATTKAEKKQLRAEIRDIKKEARQLKQQADGGIYIGGGALIVVIVLLILLL